MKLQEIPPNPGHILGIDVSQFQGDVGWSTLPASVRFAFLRATCGLGVDKKFERNASECKVPWGAYHALAYGSDPVEQARRFASTLAGRGELLPVLDFEVCRPGEKASAAVERGVTCMREIEQLTGRRCIVYTYPAFFQRLHDLGADVSPLAARPLWIAHYGRRLQAPKVPRAWKLWHFWQFGGDDYAKLDNGLDVDVNWFRGGDADLAALGCYGEG